MSFHDKNVYILGAGFSKEAGCPLQDDFLQASKMLYFSNQKKYDHFSKVFEYLNQSTKMLKHLSFPLHNLETLFNLLEMDRLYFKPRNANLIKRRFIQLIVDTLSHYSAAPLTHSRHPSNKGSVDRVNQYYNYASFISLFVESKLSHSQLRLNSDSIITFNYDLIVEATVSLFNWHYRLKNEMNLDPMSIDLNLPNGIAFNDIASYFNTSVTETIFESRLLQDNSFPALKLIKLHGSINWSDNKDTFIVPPTWNKAEKKIKHLWKSAYDELSNATRIIIIGYSLPETDTYVKSLLALAINNNDKLQNIFFINPDTAVVKERSMALIDKHFERYCEYLPWTFSQFIEEEQMNHFIRDTLNRTIRGN